MNLLLLDQFSEPGGAQQVLLELLPALGERGWQCLVGLPGEGSLFARLRELGVDAIVEGTVLRSGNRVRITANLLHALVRKFHASRHQSSGHQ